MPISFRSGRSQARLSITPVALACCPVIIEARAGTQSGAGETVAWNRSPSAANRSTVGVQEKLAP